GRFSWIFGQISDVSHRTLSMFGSHPSDPTNVTVAAERSPFGGAKNSSGIGLGTTATERPVSSSANFASTSDTQATPSARRYHFRSHHRAFQASSRNRIARAEYPLLTCAVWRA